MIIPRSKLLVQYNYLFLPLIKCYNFMTNKLINRKNSPGNLTTVMELSWNFIFHCLWEPCFVVEAHTPIHQTNFERNGFVSWSIGQNFVNCFT